MHMPWHKQSRITHVQVFVQPILSCIMLTLSGLSSICISIPACNASYSLYHMRTIPQHGVWQTNVVIIWHDGTESSKGWAPRFQHIPSPKPGTSSGRNHDPSVPVEDACHSDGAYLPKVSSLLRDVTKTIQVLRLKICCPSYHFMCASGIFPICAFVCSKH